MLAVNNGEKPSSLSKIAADETTDALLEAFHWVAVQFFKQFDKDLIASVLNHKFYERVGYKIISQKKTQRVELEQGSLQLKTKKQWEDLQKKKVF